MEKAIKNSVWETPEDAIAICEKAALAYQKQNNKVMELYARFTGYRRLNDYSVLKTKMEELLAEISLVHTKEFAVLKAQVLAQLAEATNCFETLSFLDIFDQSIQLFAAFPNTKEETQIRLRLGRRFIEIGMFLKNEEIQKKGRDVLETGFDMFTKLEIYHDDLVLVREYVRGALFVISKNIFAMDIHAVIALLDKMEFTNKKKQRVLNRLKWLALCVKYRVAKEDRGVTALKIRQLEDVGTEEDENNSDDESVYFR